MLRCSISAAKTCKQTNKEELVPSFPVRESNEVLPRIPFTNTVSLVEAAEERACGRLWAAEVSGGRRVGAFGNEPVQFGHLRHVLGLLGDGVVGSGDERDEERQHHVDEERDEGVEIELTEHPHQRPALLQLREGGKHVVSINERKQTLGHRRERAELSVVGSQDDPATEAVAHVNGSNAATEPDHVWKCSS